jgi:hypothetical protein
MFAGDRQFYNSKRSLGVYTLVSASDGLSFTSAAAGWSFLSGVGAWSFLSGAGAWGLLWGAGGAAGAIAWGGVPQRGAQPQEYEANDRLSPGGASDLLKNSGSKPK